MVLLPALWTVGHFIASRVFEHLATCTKDETLAKNRSDRAHNLQNFSRILPTPLLAIFAVGLIIECIRILPNLF
jgi:hypothetical protein